ncbi:glycosyltransferase [Dyella thiooxydans]|uniref:glycosyltransferase n=1 Tax=Dyella thiooxydans TaxID=445710 RepID=UPI0007C494F7|nr:glycosyltransferase [Dyella thiooxydans]
MNVTHVVENLNRGGLERMVLDLVGLQQRQGLKPQVVCVFEAGSLAGELDALGVPLRVCGKRRGPDLRALHRLRRAVRDHRTEVLHTHNAAAHYQAVLATLGLPGRRRVINTRHGMGAGPSASRRDALYRAAMGRTDAVVTVCEAARRDAVARGLVPESRAVVVPNGIRVERFAAAGEAARRAFRQAIGVAPETRLIGTVGRLNWAKDQDSLIRAFARVHATRPDTALVLVGQGELRGDLEDRARLEGVASAVHFLGDRNDVVQLLQGFDLFALSSVSEGYSMALLEASASALPIVATDVGGNAEIVHHGKTGMLVPAGAPESLAVTLGALLDAPDLAIALGDAARAWVLEHGSLEAMASRYARLYAGEGVPA